MLCRRRRVTTNPRAQAREILHKRTHQLCFLCTGLPALDRALGGGVPCGSISEFVGRSGNGKTQMCLSLSVHAALTQYGMLKYSLAVLACCPVPAFGREFQRPLFGSCGLPLVNPCSSNELFLPASRFESHAMTRSLYRSYDTCRHNHGVIRCSEGLHCIHRHGDEVQCCALD